MKYAISGDTLDELAVSFAEVIVRAGVATVEDNKSGKAKYAIWQLDDGTSTNPYSQGLNLTAPQSKRLNTKQGAPTVLTLKVVMRQLTDAKLLDVVERNRKAATVSEYTKMKERLERLERQIAEQDAKS